MNIVSVGHEMELSIDEQGAIVGDFELMMWSKRCRRRDWEWRE